jgi:3-hydroxyacyl-CoA dehydrogenase/enoyl-CoA hydratase/3-hydroxybutyryl-CoA epimerase
VQEVNEAALEAGMVRLTELFDKAAARGVVTAEEAQRRRAAVRGTTAFDGFGAVDVVVEAAIEELQAKRAIFQELERRTTPGTLLATNTSSLSVAALQEGLAHPERVAGLHFFNPVHKMPLVEVVCGPATAPTAADRLAAWAATLGKTPVIVGDRPGFVVNRILMPYLAEAVLLAAQEMPVELIDRTMRRFGMPMGPLELLDQIGLDVAAHVGRSLGPVAGNRFAPGGFDPAAVFDHMAKQGWLGQKNGQGFYRYAGKSKKVNSGALRLLAGTVTADASGTLGGLAPVEAMRQARERLVLAMVNEAAAVLGEGVAGAAATIDLAMIMGTGWAPHRGGPLRYAQDRGLKEVVAALEELARHHGPRFEPCAELRQRAEVGGFYGPVELAHA